MEAASSGAGTDKAPGLPELTGYITSAVGSWAHDSGASNIPSGGVFSVGGKNGEVGSSGSCIKKYQINFSASSGENYQGNYANNVFGKSSTVQPKSRTVYIYRRTA